MAFRRRLNVRTHMIARDVLRIRGKLIDRERRHLLEDDISREKLWCQRENHRADTPKRPKRRAYNFNSHGEGCYYHPSFLATAISGVRTAAPRAAMLYPVFVPRAGLPQRLST